MRRRTPLCCLALVAVIGAGMPPAGALSTPPPNADAGATEHPRLLFSAADVPALRARVNAGGVPSSAWARLRERAEGHLLKVQPAAVAANVAAPGNLNGAERPYNLQNEMNTYLIDLGMAYQLSGDARYGRRVVDLISALGDAGYPFWSGQDLGIGDLLEGIGLGFDWTYELMTPAERAKIVADIVAHEALLFDRTLLNPTNSWASNNPASNWMGVTSGGAGLTLLAISGEPGVPEAFDSYLTAALDRTQRFFRHSVDPRGAYHEGFTYAMYGLKNAVPFALAARRAGLEDLIAGTGLPLLARWVAFEQLPGEGQNFIPLNDSQRTQSGVDLQALLFAIDPDDGVAQWLWQRTVGPQGTDYYREPHVPEHLREDKCRKPYEVLSTAACDLFNVHGNVWTILYYRTPEETPEVDPATVGPLSEHHAERGLVDARTGFAGGAQEVVSTFEARRDGRAHYQYDLGGFTLYGYGGRWGIDPGYSCLACNDTNAAGYATAHNVVVIDGNKFTQAHNSRWNNDANTPIDRYVNAPNLSLARADLRYAYDFQAPYAVRDHFFSRVPGRPVVVAVTDALQRSATGSHTYTWQMLTDDANLVVPEGSAFTISAPSGATLVGRTAAGGSATADPTVKLRIEPLTNPTDDFGSLVPVVHTTTPVQQTFDHLAVMALTPAGAEPATTETLRVTGGNAIAVTWEGVQDLIVRKLAAAATVTGPVQTDAGFAKFTREAGETVLRGGTYLSADGRDYVVVTGEAATVTVSGDAVAAFGAGTNTYRVHAPRHIATVTVNGAPVGACRDGDDLAFPCAEPEREPTGPATFPGPGTWSGPCPSLAPEGPPWCSPRPAAA